MREDRARDTNISLAEKKLIITDFQSTLIKDIMSTDCRKFNKILTVARMEIAEKEGSATVDFLTTSTYMTSKHAKNMEMRTTLTGNVSHFKQYVSPAM